MKVGDQLIEINGVSTVGMSHADAIDLIKREPTVRLLVRRHPNPPVGQFFPDFSTTVWIPRSAQDFLPDVSSCTTKSTSTSVVVPVHSHTNTPSFRGSRSKSTLRF